MCDMIINYNSILLNKYVRFIYMSKIERNLILLFLSSVWLIMIDFMILIYSLLSLYAIT
jgi:hypothetical protein